MILLRVTWTDGIILEDKYNCCVTDDDTNFHISVKQNNIFLFIIRVYLLG